MSDVVVSAENLSKRYLIGHRIAHRESYTALREIISREARNFTRKAVDLVRGRQIVQGDEVEELWALKDVSFEVKQGEVIGIIGRNGAGKSTLLKVLSRITEPTQGRVRVRGRVGSLLEVGTGFHPELTGRENIFLNGAILGMRRREIVRKFDEIVAFADVEKFIDTPVKRYSTGMYVRLAFAVAAHLDPEILVVDEVLSVGDAEFQKKCLGKLKTIGSSGRTVLYVSHNLASIEALCTRCVLLASGKVRGIGPANAMVNRYLEESGVKNAENAVIVPIGAKSKSSYVESIEILDYEGRPKTDVRTWDDLCLRVNFVSNAELRNGSVEIRLSSLQGVPLFVLSTQPDQDFPVSFRKGRNSIDCLIRRLPLAAGEFHIGAGLAIPNVEWLDARFDAGILTVHPKDVYGAGLAPTTGRALLAIHYEWKQVGLSRKKPSLSPT